MFFADYYYDLGSYKEKSIWCIHWFNISLSCTMVMWKMNVKFIILLLCPYISCYNISKTLHFSLCSYVPFVIPLWFVIGSIFRPLFYFSPVEVYHPFVYFPNVCLANMAISHLTLPPLYHSSLSNAPYICRWNGSALSTKPLPEPMLN